jgi:hypothetical protein
VRHLRAIDPRGTALLLPRFVIVEIARPCQKSYRGGSPCPASCNINFVSRFASRALWHTTTIALATKGDRKDYVCFCSTRIQYTPCKDCPVENQCTGCSLGLIHFCCSGLDGVWDSKPGCHGILPPAHANFLTSQPELQFAKSRVYVAGCSPNPVTWVEGFTAGPDGSTFIHVDRLH